MSFLSNLKIRTKLILLFIFIKVIPLLLLSVVAFLGIASLSQFFTENTSALKHTTKSVVSSTANIAVSDSINALDRKSQEALERLTAQIANSVASFLSERDSDLLFLAALPNDSKTYQDFLVSKTKLIAKDKSDHYIYDSSTSSWVRHDTPSAVIIQNQADLKDNNKEFHRVDPVRIEAESVPIYKEASFFNLQGQEQVKISTLSSKKTDISTQANTYLKAEDYFKHITTLERGEIFVSDVIGAYVPSRVIGTFSIEKAAIAGIPFEPELHGYAGRENPVGKRFEGIIRFITPVYRANTKIGYVSLALDHRHIMAFTDTIDPLNYSQLDVSDGSEGNYAFMWDAKGRSISHVRDYFISGFDPVTGKRAAPWLSQEVEDAFNASTLTDINDFLMDYPPFDHQSLDKTPSEESIKQGLIGLDCRYLNFSPQCQGWMQLTENGGIGSFIIFFSNVWKLTTAATIPYYTGQYGDTQRGFGFVTIGANVYEFHKAADKTKQNLSELLEAQMKSIDTIIDKTELETTNEIKRLVHELTMSTIIMIAFVIAIAFWLSHVLRQRFQALIIGTKHYAQNNLTYQIPVDSKDEIGMLSDSFNTMARSLHEHIVKEKELNLSLEERIAKRTKQLTVLNQRIQQELTEKEKQALQLKIYANVFSKTTESIIITDVAGIILHVNQAFTKITGFLAEEAIGQSHSIMNSKDHPPSFYRKIRQSIYSKKIWQGEIWVAKKNGHLYPALVIVIPILDNTGKITHFAGIQHDMSELKQNEKILHKQAYYDPLTGLANRTLGYDRLAHAIANAKSNQSKVALLFLDLDKFKQVNDTMGHDVGDMLLVGVGTRLKEVCRETDTVSRLGGDEFLIVLEGIHFYDEVILIVKSIIDSLSQPFLVNKQTIHTSTSIGITFFPDDGDSVHQLLRNSDIAMYRAKARGRDTYEIFTEELGLQVQRSILLEQSLKEAVSHHNFIMHYQPIIALKEQKIIGVEALIRWQKQDQLHYPVDFVEMLEHTKLIIDATEGILKDVFEFTMRLNLRYSTDLYVSINISAVHFELDDFCQRLTRLTDDAMISPTLVCLEVTETIFLENLDSLSKKLNQLKQLGFMIALDDFGTGYSSLSYLKNLPLDIIKIDKAFIKELPNSAGDVAITTSVCTWGENFHMKVVAEGVENHEQLEFLNKIGCDNVQGYLFAKPMSEPDLWRYLDDNIGYIEI
jgi:diguanylate cyclase (GGDEF)-like protein/PAS domain S-box-containing protein